MMAAMHKAGVDAFLAGDQTSTQGNQLLKPTMDGTTKVFTLTASNVKWEVSKGQFVDAMAFNGQIPGPQIDVSYGDHIRFVVENQLDQPTVLHFHGMTVPNAMDGVPYITQDPIMPGQVWTYEFTVKDPPGMYVYHSHFNSTEQVGAGLYGALIVQPQGGLWPYPALTVNDRTGASDGRRSREGRRRDRRCSWATDRSATSSTGSRSRRRRRSSPRRETGS